MARPPKTPGNPYSTTVSLKLNEPAVTALDRLRGEMSRSEYLRALLREAHRKSAR